MGSEMCIRDRVRDFRHYKKHLAVRLALTIDIYEAIELVKEKLPGYEFPVERAKNILAFVERVRYDYQWENIDYQQAYRLLVKHGIPEPYVLLAEFILRDNGISP